MPTRNRTQLKGADGVVIGDIEPPPSRITDFLPQWIRWLFNLYGYVGLINENFLTVEDWNTASLINSWVDVSTDPGYYIDPLGRVYLKGHLTTGTSGTTAFVLPAGYRPPVDMYFNALGTSGAAGNFVFIDTSGNVQPTRSGVSIYLNDISFRI